MISLMPMVQTPNDDIDDGAAMNGGRRPTVVAAPVSTSPELSARPRRRTFTAKDKLRILADIDRATGTGATGAILRREGLYSSTLSDWRRQRDAGAPSATPPTPSTSPSAPAPAAAVEAPSAPSPPPMPAEAAMSDTNRRQVQETLHRLGYYQGPVDGIFGPLTRAAIRRFQQDIGTRPTGSLTADEANRVVTSR